VAEHLVQLGIAPQSAFADSVLLVVSELVTNVVRHARGSTVMDVGITLGSGQLVIGVSDGDPRLPDLSPDGMGPGLRIVAEVAAGYDGDISAEPAVNHVGKIVLARFQIPAQTDGGSTP
jgi:two-component sensor histidine kinase